MTTKFRVGKMPDLPFRCEAAVWLRNGSSLCYTTSKERAKWIAQKLNFAVEFERRFVEIMANSNPDKPSPKRTPKPSGKRAKK
jgi:hypothetical protein